MTTSPKFELTSETRDFFGVIFYRIRALRDLANVKAGDFGGWISKEANLSHEGNCWVSDNARVFGDAQVSGNAWVYGNARVYGNAQASDNAKIQTRNDIIWFSNVGSENGTLTAFKTDAGICVTRGCFTGSLDEFKKAVEKRHGNNQYGAGYLILIDFINHHFANC